MNSKKIIYIFLCGLMTFPQMCSKKEYACNNSSNSFLQFLYNTSPGTYVRPFFTRPWFSKIAGWYANTRISALHIKSFIKNNKIDMREAQREKTKEYHSFNDFFTRKLKINARPIAQEIDAIISPSDGMLFAFDNIDHNTTLFAKNKEFDLATFLQDSDQAAHFMHGTLFVIYLAPWNYHRFHLPYQSKPAALKRIHGYYESVNPSLYQMDRQPLLENERACIRLTTCDNTQFSMVCIGALCVGSIVTTYVPGYEYNKGAELGFFSFGGSTVVLLFPKNTIKCTDNIEKTMNTGLGVPVKMGQTIACFLRS